MYQSPRRAKRLYFDVIPRAVDDYYTELTRFPQLEPAERLESPAFHIHGGAPPQPDVPVSFSVLLNIVSGAHVTDKERLWGFVRRYRPDAGPEKNPELDRLIGYAVRYYLDFVAPHQVFRAPTEQEAEGMARLIERLRALPAAPIPRPSSSSSTRPARTSASPTCASGSRRSTSVCSATRRVRGWGASPRSTASTRRSSCSSDALRASRQCVDALARAPSLELTVPFIRPELDPDASRGVRQRALRVDAARLRDRVARSAR